MFNLKTLDNKILPINNPTSTPNPKPEYKDPENNEGPQMLRNPRTFLKPVECEYIHMCIHMYVCMYACMHVCNKMYVCV